jgi:hypothetical protein
MMPPMKLLLVLLVWGLLFALCWPLALLMFVAWPVLWLVSLPVRLVVIAVEAVFALLRSLLFLPARIFGHRDRAS